MIHSFIFLFTYQFTGNKIGIEAIIQITQLFNSNKCVLSQLDIGDCGKCLSFVFRFYNQLVTSYYYLFVLIIYTETDFTDTELEIKLFQSLAFNSSLIKFGFPSTMKSGIFLFLFPFLFFHFLFYFNSIIFLLYSS